MTRLILPAIAVVVLAVTLLLYGGVPRVAAAVGPAAGTDVYIKGEFEATYPAPFDRTWNATMGVLQDATLQITDTKKQVGEGDIKALQSDSTPVTIALKEAGPDATEVDIRVGTLGNLAASRAIANRIAARLGTAER